MPQAIATALVRRSLERSPAVARPCYGGRMHARAHAAVLAVPPVRPLAGIPV